MRDLITKYSALKSGKLISFKKGEKQPNIIHVTQKRYDSDTQEELDDRAYRIDLNALKDRKQELEAELVNLKQLIADIEAL